MRYFGAHLRAHGLIRTNASEVRLEHYFVIADGVVFAGQLSDDEILNKTLAVPDEASDQEEPCDVVLKEKLGGSMRYFCSARMVERPKTCDNRPAIRQK